VLNIVTGFCTCHDFAQNRTCAHLYAAQLHPDWCEHCRWQASAPELLQRGDEAIPIARSQPLGLPPDVEEPTAQFDVEQEVHALKAACAAVRTSSSAAAAATQVSDEAKQFMRSAATVSRFAKLAHLVPVEQLTDGLGMLQQVEDWCTKTLPALQSVKSAPHNGNRQDSDRTMKVLYKSHGRKRARSAAVANSQGQAKQPQLKRKRNNSGASQTAAAPDAAASQLLTRAAPADKLVAVKESGRPRTVERCIGNFTSRHKATYPSRSKRTTNK
jgi:hypothetical protein